MTKPLFLFASLLMFNIAAFAQISWQQVHNTSKNYYSLASNNKTGQIFSATTSGGTQFLVSDSVGSSGSWTDKTPKLPSKAKQPLGVFTHNDILFIVDQDSGIFRSEDNGDTWTDANSGLTGYDKSHLQAIVSLGGQELLLKYGGGQAVETIFYSTDNGKSWLFALTTSSSEDIYSIIKSAGNIYAITIESVHKSTDGGKTWNDLKANIPKKGASRTVALSDNSFIMVIEGDDFLYKSTDEGVNWTKITHTGLTASGLQIGTLLKSPGSDTLYISTEDNSGLNPGAFGIYYSSDKGASWSSFSNGLTNPHVYRWDDEAAYIMIGHNGYMYASMTNYGGIYRTSAHVTKSTVVSVEKTQLLISSLTLYPNPADELLNIEISLKAKRQLAVIITDMSGKQLLAEQHLVQQGNNEISLDVSDMPAGSYMVSIDGDNVQVAQQFTKL